MRYYLSFLHQISEITFWPHVPTGLSCVGEDGESSNMTECLRWAGPLVPQIRGCWVACKDDCTLTAWSKFSECAGCGSSKTRKRALIGKDPTVLSCEIMTDIVSGSCFIFKHFHAAVVYFYWYGWQQLLLQTKADKTKCKTVALSWKQHVQVQPDAQWCSQYISTWFVFAPSFAALIVAYWSCAKKYLQLVSSTAAPLSYSLCLQQLSTASVVLCQVWLRSVSF